MISVTLQFTDIAAAAHALMRMATITGDGSGQALPLLPGHQAPAAIAHIDRPDVGAPVAPPTPPADPAAAAFGGAVAQAAPLVAPAAIAPLTPPPAAPSAPTAAIGQTAVPGTVERDATGLPWDGRIHASTKTKTKEGVWTAKRNVDAAFKAQVEADLRGVPVAQAAANPLAGMPAPSTGAALPPAAPQTAPASAATPTFASYMAEIGAAFSNRPLDAHAHMASALAAVGMQHVGQLAGRPDLIPQVDAEFRRLLG